MRLAKWLPGAGLVPAAAVVLMLKCPLCYAAYLGVLAGLGFGKIAAAVVCAAAAAAAAIIWMHRRRGVAAAPSCCAQRLARR